ncbi:MAG: AAA family ATPase [Smithellaceae bacterium]|nr:AAA family ATPase [Smithellaceae bacterium]
MDYFNVLNLKREPFSNSPDPDFFFQSEKHLACLQRLEIAIRLHRGLNVVIGDVGTGKTTLCRQLIQVFSADSPASRVYIIMDPAVSQPTEFLSAIASAFKINLPSDADEFQIREIIKAYLFAEGVEDGKTILLIIDEGQRMPEFGLEILRELLNYETNDRKLLQIVIFAQQEFGQMLKRHRAFADRVNMTYRLTPLNYAETRNMIRFRLSRAAETAPPPEIFSGMALWCIYQFTGGYPRKIVTLCHHIILTMIIHERNRADVPLVLACVNRLFPTVSGRLKRASVASSAVLVLGGASVFYLAIDGTYLSGLSLPSGKGIATKVRNIVTIPSAVRTDVSTGALKPVLPSVTESPGLDAPKVIGNSATKHYHLKGMRFYNEVLPDHRVEFRSEEDAIKAGYHKADM